MDWKLILSMLFGAAILVGAVEFAYQICRITMLDARTRGLKHPKFWGAFALSGSNSSGFLLYLIGRRKFPVTNCSDRDRREIDRRRKATDIGLIFLAAGAVGLLLTLTLI